MVLPQENSPVNGNGPWRGEDTGVPYMVLKGLIFVFDPENWFASDTRSISPNESSLEP